MVRPEKWFGTFEKSAKKNFEQKISKVIGGSQDLKN